MDNITIKGTGHAYQICSAAYELYYNRQTLLWLPKLIEELNQAGDEAKEKIPQFNKAFFDDLADKMLRMFMDGKLKDVREDDIKNTFLRVWKFHRKWLVAGVKDDAHWDALCQEANVLAIEEPSEYVRLFYNAVLRDLERLSKAEEQPTKAEHATHPPVRNGGAA